MSLKPEACQQLAGGRAKRHHRLAVTGERHPGRDASDSGWLARAARHDFSGDFRSRLPSDLAGIPAGMHHRFLDFSGGIASLNHRLIIPAKLCQNVCDNRQTVTN